MKKELLRKSNFVCEEGGNEKLVLEYFITQTERPFKSGNIKFICYGVEIVQRKKDNVLIDSKIINEIFSSKENAIEFINKLADGLVTPCTLENIVSDSLIEALSN